MSLVDRLDEFTSRQEIVSAEWCNLLDEVEKLQEQNKELANLLRDSFRYSDGLEGFYVNEWRDRAREALAKVRDR